MRGQKETHITLDKYTKIPERILYIEEWYNTCNKARKVFKPYTSLSPMTYRGRFNCYHEDIICLYHANYTTDEILKTLIKKYPDDNDLKSNSTRIKNLLKRSIKDVRDVWYSWYHANPEQYYEDLHLTVTDEMKSWLNIYKLYGAQKYKQKLVEHQQQPTQRYINEVVNTVKNESKQVQIQQQASESDVVQAYIDNYIIMPKMISLHNSSNKRQILFTAVCTKLNQLSNTQSDLLQKINTLDCKQVYIQNYMTISKQIESYAKLKYDLLNET